MKIYTVIIRTPDKINNEIVKAFYKYDQATNCIFNFVNDRWILNKDNFDSLQKNNNLVSIQAVLELIETGEFDLGKKIFEQLSFIKTRFMIYETDFEGHLLS